jgi:centromere protein J
MNGSTGSNINGNNFDDFINDMGKYLNSNTKNNKPSKIVQEDNLYQQQENFEESQNNRNNLDHGNLMDKEKLFQNFMMFMNSQQMMNVTESKDTRLNKKEVQINDSSSLNNSVNFNLNNSSNFVQNLDKSNLNKKINSDNNLTKSITDNNFEVEKKENSYKNFKEIENKPIINKQKLTSYIEDDDDDGYTEPQENNFNSSPLNIDDIPIQPKAKNFMELLEQNLANDNGDMYSNEYIKPKKIIEYKPRQRRSNMLHISQPTETKKYKYYSQNYDKEFGLKPEHEIEAEKFLQAQKENEEKNKNKNKGKYAPRGKVERNQGRLPPNKEKPSNMVRGKSEARMNTKLEMPKENNIKSNVSGSNNVSNIWEDLKEVNKILGPDKEDDFLNMNSYSKVKANSIHSNPIKENKKILGQNSENFDNFNKLSTKELSRFNESNTNSLNNSSLNPGVYTKNIPETNKNKFQKDQKEPEIYSKAINITNLPSSDDYEIKMPQVKPNIVKTQTKVNPITEQVISMASNSKVLKNIENIRSPNESMERSIEKENDNEDLNDHLNLSDNQGEDEDDDDNRDIIKMYENKYKTNQTNNNSNNNIIQNTPHNLEDNYSSNNNQNLYKKPEQQKIINKYFKPIINKENNSNMNPTLKKSNQNINVPSIENAGDLVNEKISELNAEIEKIKRENEKVSKLKAEYDRLTKKLNREVEEFSGKKEKEIEEFNKWKDEEIKKIEKERKVYLRNTKLLQNMPNRKEREEIESLKEQVLKLQEEMKAKDQRNKLAMDRLKKQLEDANKKTEDLQKEIKFMEELRLKNMVSAAPVKNTGNNSASNNLASKKNVTGNITPNNNYSTNNTQAQATSTPQTLTTNKSLKNIPVNSGNKQSDIKLNPSIQNINSQATKNVPISGGNKQGSMYNNVPTNKKTISNDDDISDYYSNNNFSKVNKNKFEDEIKQDDDDADLYEEKENSQDEDYKSYNNENFNCKKNLAHNEYEGEGDLEIKMNKVKVVKTSGFKSETPINTISNNSKIQVTQANSSKKPLYSESNTNIGNSNIIQANKQKITSEPEEENFEMEFPEKYHGKSSKNVKLLRQDFTEDGKIIKIYENMKKEIIFPSGVKKETFEDGYTITYFNNKDIKQLYPDGREVYLFFDNKTLQFKFPDGLHVFKFSTGQTEKHYPDGSKVLNYTDGTITNVYPDGYQETFFPDGSLKKVDPSGVITFDYEDGMKVRNF